jgi:hypothetical protein
MKSETRRAFELFVEKTNKLKALSFNEALKDLKLNISWKKGEDFEVHRAGPTNEQIDAFVLTFRLFIQDNDQFSFRWLANNALNDPGVSDHWKQEFSRVRNEMRQYLDKCPPIQTFIQEDAPPTHRDILNVFVYGDLSHVSDDKRALFRKWMSHPIIPEVLQLEFIQILSLIFHQIIVFVANLCEAELKNSSS